MNVRVVGLIRAAMLTAALGTTACDRSMTTPSPFVSATATVAGLVWLHDTGGVKPYANVDVGAFVQVGTEGSGTGVSGWRVDPIRSGPDGRYSFTVPTGAFVRLHVQASFQPCVTAIAVSGNGTNLDVHSIVDPAKLGAHLPSELLVNTSTLSGTVFEMTALGRQPVPGVRLQLDMFGGLGDVSADTLTDSDGRYVLCGLGGVASTYVWASKSGYRSADVGNVPLNGNTIRDIELLR